MIKNTKVKPLTKSTEIQLDKIGVVFNEALLRSVLKILTMHHSGFRTSKSVRNINRLFTHVDLNKYTDQTLISYIWCICYVSKQWLDGIVDVDLIIEGAKRTSEWDNLKDDIITSCINDQNIISAPEARLLFDLISEALQYGSLVSIKDEYAALLDEIHLDHPGAFKALAERLFAISQSLLDIKYNTNLVTNQLTFDTGDVESVKESISQTIASLQTSNNIFKVGIRRLNTLLSPGYMNGRLYVYLGLPGAYKSGMLLKTALDIRKYNTDFKPKTPGMKPCVLFITMENTFTETIERIWNMTFNDPLTNYTMEEACEKLMPELGSPPSDMDDLSDNPLERKLNGLKNKGNPIEIAIKYFPYRSISTDDLFTIIQDYKEKEYEICALVFDYIKRIRPSTPAADNVKLELNRIINELKALAVITDIPVITAHQMNRAAAATVDAAARQGKGDVTKLVGREHTGDSWEIIESSDWAAILNMEYKPGTDEKYLVINVVKRRRIESGESDLSKITYLAHPFSKMGFRLIDDFKLDKVLSVSSLVTEIDSVGKEKTNAIPRLKQMDQSQFVEFEDDNSYEE